MRDQLKHIVRGRISRAISLQPKGEMMKRNLFASTVFLLTLASLCICPPRSNGSEAVFMNMVTGSVQGTYYQFGLDLEKLMERNGIDLAVHNSDGSVENIYAVFKRPNTQLGIVQSDVLAFVAKVNTDPVLKEIANKIKMVYPLYNEEVHLVGKSSLKRFDDLDGKKVAIGQEGSGSYLTAKLFFKVSGVNPAEMVEVSADEALPQLKAGLIDAMFYVAGYPVKLFRDQVEDSDNLVILRIDNEKITEFYEKATIPKATYAWQDEDVSTVAIKSVLISYNFRMANCDNVGHFAEAMVTNIDWLQQNGHPKWKAVDLNYDLKGWEQYDCVKKRTARPQQKGRRQEINPVLDAIKDIL